MSFTDDPIVQWAPGMSLENLEHNVIMKAYRFYKENKTSTAHALGISIRTLDARLEKINEILQNEKTQNERVQREREIFLRRSRGIQTNQTDDTASNRVEAASRSRVESTSISTAKPSMSLSVGQEVQEVLSKPAAASGQGRRRS